MSVKVTVYVQVADGAIQPVGASEGDSPDDVRAGLAALLRTMSAHADTSAAWMEVLLRYDEEDE